MDYCYYLYNFNLTQEEKNGTPAAEATVIKLLMQQPFITKMDATLQSLAACE